MTITKETIAELRELLANVSPERAAESFHDRALRDWVLRRAACDHLPTLLDAATECLELREERERQRKDPLLALYDRVCIANADIRQQLAAMTKEREEAKADALLFEKAYDMVNLARYEAVERGDRWKECAGGLKTDLMFVGHFSDDPDTVELYKGLLAAETPGEKEGI